MVTSGHVTKMAVTPFDPLYPKTPQRMHANLMALSFIEPELWAIKVLHCGNMDFRPFCSCYLDDKWLDDPRTWPVFSGNTSDVQI